MTKKARKGQRYARLMGDFWQHTRIAKLSLAAVGLHAKAMSYVADQMSDGDVTRPALAAFFVGPVDETLVAELVKHGVWKTKKDGTWRLRDWSQHNITRSAWEQQKEATKGRVQKHRAARSGNAPVQNGNALQTVGNGSVRARTQTSLDQDQEEDQDQEREPRALTGSSDPAPSRPSVTGVVTLPEARSLGVLAEELRVGVVRGFEALRQPAPRECRELTWHGWVDFARWVRSKARTSNADESATGARAIRSFLESDKARKKGFPVAFLVQNPLEYWSDAA
jgi:hypothetical protein